MKHRSKGPRSDQSANPQRLPIVRAFFDGLLDPEEMIVDNFAGGGGASTGVARALGRDPDIAINHDPEAIAMHRANHPNTRHYIEDVWQVDPREACGNRPVGFAWFSPTCTFFSKARGGPLGEDAIKIRGLCWVAVRWATRVCPRVIAMENVEEFQKFGPLHRTHSGTCRGSVGKTCPRDATETPLQRAARVKRGDTCCYNTPIKAREGEFYRRFIGALEGLGYVVETRVLRACDYGAPTTRKRWFLVARRDGRPIRWPTPSHGPSTAVPYRPASSVIDWSIPCPSIFDRKKPLADSTLRRIARGIRKFVLENPRPFVVPTCHAGDDRVHDIDVPLPTVAGNRGMHAIVTPLLIKAKSYGGGGNEAMSIEKPLQTVTASKRGEFAIAVPYLVHRSNGERPATATAPGQAPRVYDIDKPLGTIVAQGLKHALTVAVLVKHNGGNNDRRASGANAQDVTEPMHTVSARDAKGLTVAHLVKFSGTSPAHIAASASSLESPVPTVTAKGRKAALVSAFLVRYNAASGPQPVDAPLGTIDTTDRYGLVTVEIDGETYVVADVGMRMLVPRELFNAQSFPPEYVIAPEYEGKPLTQTAQIRCAGNSVPPDVAEAIARAQFEPESVAA